MLADRFDAVDRLMPDGSTTRLSRKEFDALPLSERVRAVLRKQLRFWKDGTEISSIDALSDRD